MNNELIGLGLAILGLCLISLVAGFYVGLSQSNTCCEDLIDLDKEYICIAKTQPTYFNVPNFNNYGNASIYTFS